MELSFTKLRVWLECPWKYKLRFVDGRRAPLSCAGSLGLSLHRALERFHRDGHSEPEELLRCYEASFLAAGYPDAETREKWRAKGRRILERYARAELQRRAEIVCVEREFVYPLGGHEVRGMIDRVDRHPDGRFEVIDYKTAAGADREPRDELQLRFYALGCKECLAKEPALLTDYFIAELRRETWDYDPSGEDELKRLIVGAAEGIERGRFAPNASFCPRCDFRNGCVHSRQA
ncbi:MAG: PD-(D/E)XK nuclease family protein [Elusimicrobia bacterium]|nr:PD-(D/E)XK nuclease family protein [Elusimicrobiota bacterium]